MIGCSKSVIKNLTQIRVELTGSTAAKLEMRGSDLDILILPEQQDGDMAPLTRLARIHHYVDTGRIPGYRVVKFVVKTKVPVLTLKHKHTEVDITGYNFKQLF